MGIRRFAVSAVGQLTTGTISGIARDSTAAVIPGVNIPLKNLDTGLTRTVVTDAQGHYQAPSLPLGNYEVQAEKEGFQTGIHFNAINHGNFGTPATQIFDGNGNPLPLSTVGRIRSTTTASRQVQFGLKFSW